MDHEIDYAVLISANAEWRALREQLPSPPTEPSPYGDWFVAPVEVAGQSKPVLFFHGGWGKIAAAGSTQYVIDRWAPALVVNLGTCGGLATGSADGETAAVQRGTIVLAERTLVYDIVEQMTDPEEAIAYYAVDLDLSWLATPYPQPVCRTLLLSADRDILAGDVPMLAARFGAVAADWESGAIAWVSARNHTRCLILRGVSDMVGQDGGEAYGEPGVFFAGTARVMADLLAALPAWLARAMIS